MFLSYEEIVAEFWNSKLIYNWCIVIGGLRRIIKIISSFRKFRRNLAARDWERLDVREFISRWKKFHSNKGESFGWNRHYVF